MSLFKKFAATTLALTMVFSLAACGGSSDTATTEEGGDAATTGKVYKIGTDTTFAPLSLIHIYFHEIIYSKKNCGCCSGMFCICYLLCGSAFQRRRGTDYC